MAIAGENRTRPVSTFREIANILTAKESRRMIAEKGVSHFVRSEFVSPIQEEIRNLKLGVQMIGFDIQTRGAIPLGPNGSRPTILPMAAVAGGAAGGGSAAGAGTVGGTVGGSAPPPGGNATTKVKAFAKPKRITDQIADTLYRKPSTKVMIGLGILSALLFPLNPLGDLIGTIVLGSVLLSGYRYAYLPLRKRLAWRSINKKADKNDFIAVAIAKVLHQAKTDSNTIFKQILSQKEIDAQLAHFKPAVRGKIEKQMLILENWDKYTAITGKAYSVDEKGVKEAEADLKWIQFIQAADQLPANQKIEITKFCAELKTTINQLKYGISFKEMARTIYTVSNEGLQAAKGNETFMTHWVNGNFLLDSMRAEAQAYLTKLKEYIVQIGNGMKLNKTIELKAKGYAADGLGLAEEHLKTAQEIPDDKLPPFMVLKKTELIRSLNSQIKLLNNGIKLTELNEINLADYTSADEAKRDLKSIEILLTKDLSHSIVDAANIRKSELEAKIAEFEAAAGVKTPTPSIPPSGFLPPAHVLAEIDRIRTDTYGDNLIALEKAHEDLKFLRDKSDRLDLSADIKKVSDVIRDLSVKFDLVVKIVVELDMKEYYLLPSNNDSEKRVAREKVNPMIKNAYFLGKGGMGEVYKAIDPITGELTAVKFLLDPLYKDRFLEEIKANEVLRNTEGVVKVYGSGQYGPSKVLNMVMEYINGPTLDDHAVKDAYEAVDIAIQISDIMARVHAMGITHRDLKPGNIFTYIDKDGKRAVKIADMGLAKLLADGKKTDTGILAGTLSFMAPYFMVDYGSIHRTGPSGAGKDKIKEPLQKNDIFAVGGILYRLLTKVNLTWQGDTKGRLRIFPPAAASANGDARLLGEAEISGDYAVYSLAKKKGNNDEIDKYLRKYTLVKDLLPRVGLTPEYRDTLFEIIAKAASVSIEKTYANFVELKSALESLKLGLTSRAPAPSAPLAGPATEPTVPAPATVTPPSIALAKEIEIKIQGILASLSGNDEGAVRNTLKNITRGKLEVPFEGKRKIINRVNEIPGEFPALERLADQVLGMLRLLKKAEETK